MLPSNNSNDCIGNLSYTSIRLLLILWVIFWYQHSLCTPEAKYFTETFFTSFSNFLRCPKANGLSWRKVKDLSSLNVDRQFPMLFFLRLFKTTRNGKWSLKTKWIIQLLLMRQIFQWLIKIKIMKMITGHRTQEG